MPLVIVANPVTAKISDGTNTAAVKASTTAAVVTDPALVVAISPNNSVDVTGAVGIIGTAAVSAASLPLPAGAATASNQTTAGSQTTKINDGTNTAAVKAASTAAVATDTALVVAISPNTTAFPVTSNQGSAASLSGHWPVQITDGTNVMPTMDSAARAGFVKVTDGTNTMPTMDAVARPGFQTVTDGTSVVSVKAGSATIAGSDNSLVVQISPNQGAYPVTSNQGLANGLSHSWPVLISDTTNTATVKAASTAAGASDTALVVAVSPNNSVAITAASLPLPALAATSTIQTNGTQKTQVVDGSGNVQNSGDIAARALFDKITDGTNTAAVKAASTSATTTDPALVVSVSPNSSVPITFADAGTEDPFGQLFTSVRDAQIAVNFFEIVPPVTITTTGLGETLQSAGVFDFLVLATSGSTCTGVSYNSLSCSAQQEMYAAMSATFTTGVSGTHQRLGIYNANDGFSFGYNGATFGLWTRYNTTDTAVARTSWNVDTLSGSAGSKFTSGGSPVAIDPTKMNVYRIRFGGLGAANTIFEVMSPDGDFVVVHVVKYVNSQANLSITSPNLPMTADVANGAVSTLLTVSCGYWVAGVSSPGEHSLLNGIGTIAANGAMVNLQIINQESITAIFSGTWTGTIAFQYSIDTNTWINDTVWDTTSGKLVSSFSSTSSGVSQTFVITTGSYKQYRFNATAWSSGTLQINYGSGPAASQITIASQGAAATLAGHWPVQITDGTNTMPTMDVASRPGFVKVTDGTNTQPTMDAVGRPGFVKVTDGANTQPAMDAAARPGFVKITDGTNTMPTMDAAGRPGFQKITDGTSVVSVKAASTAAVAADLALVVAVSPNNTVAVGGQKATTATLSNVPGSASSVTLLALNTARLSAVIYNDSTAILYVKFGSTASTTSYTYQLQANMTLELMQIPMYTGIITGIWASATGSARVTEITA